MRVQVNLREEPGLRLELARDEIAIFRAALERANFIDTRPDMQGLVLDFLERLLAQLPEEAKLPPPRRT